LTLRFRHCGEGRSPVRQTTTSEKARQGHWGRHVLLILIAALFLAAIAWLGAEIFGEATETPATTSQASWSMPA
jgi:hypothetical protein